MKTITVEGYEVEITKVDDKYVASVPKLPGCIVQVDNEGDARGEIRKMMGLYLQGVAEKAGNARGNNPKTRVR
jgi:predicted RNase H-like HicB family nuclease